mgnify:CR=1 FL=1
MPELLAATTSIGTVVLDCVTSRRASAYSNSDWDKPAITLLLHCRLVCQKLNPEPNVFYQSSNIMHGHMTTEGTGMRFWHVVLRSVIDRWTADKTSRANSECCVQSCFTESKLDEVLKLLGIDHDCKDSIDDAMIWSGGLRQFHVCMHLACTCSSTNNLLLTHPARREIHTVIKTSCPVFNDLNLFIYGFRQDGVANAIISVLGSIHCSDWNSWIPA